MKTPNSLFNCLFTVRDINVQICCHSNRAYRFININLQYRPTGSVYMYSFKSFVFIASERPEPRCQSAKWEFKQYWWMDLFKTTHGIMYTEWENSQRYLQYSTETPEIIIIIIKKESNNFSMHGTKYTNRQYTNVVRDRELALVRGKQHGRGNGLKWRLGYWIQKSWKKASYCSKCVCYSPTDCGRSSFVCFSRLHFVCLCLH